MTVLFSAYEVLSDADKRRHYDQFGDDSDQPSGGGGAGGFDFNFNDFFRGFDEAFKAHNDHHHHHHQQHQQNHFQFHFGGGKNQFFNFDDLFEDEDDGSYFGFDPFENFASFDFGFGDQIHNHYDARHNGHHQRHMHAHAQHHQQHQQHHANVHQHMNSQNVRVNTQGTLFSKNDL